MAICGSWCRSWGRLVRRSWKFAGGRDHRTPTARRAARSSYQAHLRRAIERHFPDFTLTKLSNAVDLEKSFGPIYARGVLRRGRSVFAVLGVNQYETQASIDAALTFGI